MKKYKKARICGLLLALPLLLTGCATVSSVIDRETGRNVYFDEITYFGGNAVKVGSYLYYANGYSSISDSNFNYNEAAQTGNLARLDLYNGVDAQSNKEAPKGIEVVNNKLAGYENQYMFAYQNYLYFTSANTHQTTGLENDYTRVTMFRVMFNGDNVQELFTTKYDSSSFIKAVEGSDGNGYIVTYSKTDSSSEELKDSYQLTSMKIGDNLGKRDIIAEKVTSAVVDDSISSNDNRIYYTKDSELGTTTNKVYSIDYATKDIKNHSAGLNTNATIKMLAKVDDQLFYHYKQSTNSAIYKTDVSSGASETDIGNSKDIYHTSEDIKNLLHVGKGTLDEGFVFTASGNLLYKKNGEKDPTPILSSDKFKNILFVDGDYVYYSNETEIGRISFKANNGEYKEEVIVKMTKIISGEYAFVDGYIYFFAGYEEPEVDENDEDAVEYEEDTNVYMYRIKAGSPDDIGSYQLMGKNKQMPVKEKTEEE